MKARKLFSQVLLAAFLFAFAGIGQAKAEEPLSRIIRDEAAGYILALPEGWREVTEPRELEALAFDVCSMFIADGGIRSARHMRGASLPGDHEASPGLFIFALDYNSLGLSDEAVRAMAREPAPAVASLANSLQRVYLERYPQSLMVNNHLGDDYFSLNLRSVETRPDGVEETSNRHLKFMLTSDGAVILMTSYKGQPIPEYDKALAAAMRETIVLREKNLQSILPPYKASVFDYLLVLAAFFVVIVIIRKLRAAMRG